MEMAVMSPDAPAPMMATWTGLGAALGGMKHPE